MARLTATKAGRLELQNYEFTNLLNKGFTRENYGDLAIFTMTDNSSSWLKIFRGTAAKEVIYKRYRTEAQSIEAVKNAKASHDRSKAYKEELKANPIKSCSANCATAIREELKKEFPAVKFSVKSSNFAGGDSVHISWIEGPTSREVDAFTNKYQYGSFDGMTDMYNYSNTREDLPQSKYVSTRREISEEVNNIVFESLKLLSPDDRQDYEIKQDCYRIISKTPFKPGATVTGVTTTGQNGSIEDFYTLTFLLPETPEPKETPNFEAVEVPEGEIQIIDYSEKAIAVIGNTKPIKDQLKAIGGKFNFRLSCGAGWIFSKKQLSEVQQLLSGGSAEKLKSEAEETTTLKDEVQKTINWMAETDVKIYGELTESVKECARVQEVEIYNNLDDINQASESGKVISLCNLFDLVNAK